MPGADFSSYTLNTEPGYLSRATELPICPGQVLLKLHARWIAHAATYVAQMDRYVANGVKWPRWFVEFDLGGPVNTAAYCDSGAAIPAPFWAYYGSGIIPRQSVPLPTDVGEYKAFDFATAQANGWISAIPTAPMLEGWLALRVPHGLTPEDYNLTIWVINGMYLLRIMREMAEIFCLPWA